ncbi:MAG: WYL domain-containing protein, partial [Pseudobutyrivibrio sp.]|nr:WYL domain-containing protein [Pseudobutyrivibrio sp.]
MAVSQQKLKTLYVMQILLEKTDENHMLSAQGIIDLLQMQHGMTADRKSIYSDIELLKEFGMDIVQQKGTNPGYYVGSRDFELAELKMLVDAVQSSKFITQKKS